MTQKQVIVTVTVNKVPHPNPQRAMDLIAKLFLKNFSDELFQTCAIKPLASAVGWMSRKPTA